MNQILSIDVGSTKICSAIAEIKDGKPVVLSSDISESQGLKKGTVDNIEKASQAIKNSVEKTKKMAGSDVSSATISISGAYTKGVSSSAITNIKNNIVTLEDIVRCIKTAIYNASIPQDCEILHVLPYHFKLDENDYIEDPIDMSGSKLEVHTRIVCAKKDSIENLRRAVKLAGIEVNNVVLSAYASSIATLNDSERQLGTACVDIGGDTCELMIQSGLSMIYNDFTPLGSNNITSDLAQVFHIIPIVAEKLKLETSDYRDKGVTTGSLEVFTGNKDEFKKLSLPKINEIIDLRFIEILKFLNESIIESKLKDKLRSGIVITGGGAGFSGLREMASMVFKIPVRIAKPIKLEGLSEKINSYDSAVITGLILYASGGTTNYEQDSSEKIRLKKDKKIIGISDFEIANLSRDTTSSKEFYSDDLTQIKDIKADEESKKSSLVSKAISKLKLWASSTF